MSELPSGAPNMYLLKRPLDVGGGGTLLHVEDEVQVVRVAQHALDLRAPAARIDFGPFGVHLDVGLFVNRRRGSSCDLVLSPHQVGVELDDHRVRADPTAQ